MTVKTISKVLDALDLSATVEFTPQKRVDRRMIGYVVAAINEFAKTHKITTREASNYLTRFKGIDFIAEHYEAEHLLSFDDSVQDLTRVCFNNGGGIQ